jgi:hypothetical protein
MIAVAHPLWIACSLLCAATSGGLLLRALDERAGSAKWFAAAAFVIWSALSVFLVAWEVW